MRPTVIYHSADYDGIFCREIARRFLPDATLIGWNFGDSLIPMPEGELYVLDLSPDCVSNFDASRCIWIDHHKTSIEKYGDAIPGYRIDGVAACRLAWQWFTMVDGNTPRKGAEISVPIRPAGILPMIQDFKNREVNEPLAVRLAGEYDIWDKRDPDTETFQYALRVEPLTPVGWAALFDDDRAFVASLLVEGRVCQRYNQGVDADICNSRTWLMEWEGLRFLCVNSARFNSLLFAARDVPETGHDALLGFCFNGKCWTASLYHAKHRTDLDLSAIAKRYGGGGHRGACGFTCATLPFALAKA